MADIQILTRQVEGIAQKDQTLLGTPFAQDEQFVDALSLIFDANIQETPTYESQPTVSPIESGAQISDHIFLQPEKVTLHFIISDTPVDLIRNLESVLFSSGLKPTEYALLILKIWYRNREVVDLVTNLQIYKNMCIQSLSVMRDKDTGSILDITLTFQKLNIVNSEITVVSDELIKGSAYGPSGTKPGDFGQENTEAPSDGEFPYYADIDDKLRAFTKEGKIVP